MHFPSENVTGKVLWLCRTKFIVTYFELVDVTVNPPNRHTLTLSCALFVDFGIIINSIKMIYDFFYNHLISLVMPEL